MEPPEVPDIEIVPVVLIEGYVSEAPDIRDRPGVLIPVPNAQIYFIRNNIVFATATSNAVGFYSVAIPAGDYTVAAAAPGFQTLIREQTFRSTQTHDIGLTPIPFNGFVPYALYPVLETSPGREFDCTIVVENFQIIDQMVTFTAVTPPEWQAWFPLGEAMMVRTGDSNEMIFRMKYTGKQQGAHTIKVVVNGGAYFAEIPVIVVVKDLPFESMDFYATSPEKYIKPGNTADFILYVENKYAQDKLMNIRVDDIPPNWSATTGNGTELFIPDGKITQTHFYVYVPAETPPGNYTVNVTLCGDGIQSNTLTLKLRVEADPLYDAIIKSHNRSPEGYPEFNVSTGTAFDIPVRIYNSWTFPVNIQASALIADNWPYYIDGVPGGRVKISPGKAQEFTIRTMVPNGTYGTFPIKVYLESPGRDMTLTGSIVVPAPEPSPTPELPATHGWEGPALTGITAGAILFTIAASLLRKMKF
ncbi:hypothetical protein RCIX1745 [Methanocella arvoryzae MRE50]|uniref:Alpha-galactosidase NEW3 domain-containing protein n=1 Tax=Methanocella arvoryzae (strain DSM 22066 / NBRC 105507 / MRE50) TaxID=351160 RepID=Q0W3T9_METAR|nr:hypothetical protein RCIX1745 [Methanocella arvoryzae MRE50]